MTLLEDEGAVPMVATRPKWSLGKMMRPSPSGESGKGAVPMSSMDFASHMGPCAPLRNITRSIRLRVRVFMISMCSHNYVEIVMESLYRDLPEDVVEAAIALRWGS